MVVSLGSSRSSLCGLGDGVEEGECLVGSGVVGVDCGGWGLLLNSLGVWWFCCFHSLQFEWRGVSSFDSTQQFFPLNTKGSHTQVAFPSASTIA